MSDYNPQYVFVKNFYLIGVKIILENKSGEILLLKRSSKVPRTHSWDLPGGAVDASEAPEQAIIRELLEETGITITNPQLCTSHLNTAHEDDAIILGFFAKIEQADVVLSWEHEAYEWMTPERLVGIDLPDIYAEMIINHAKRAQ